MGQFSLSKISSRPVAHLFCWVIEAGPPVGAHPKKAGGSGEYRMDLQPLLWIESPVRTSSVVDPYIHPT